MKKISFVVGKDYLNNKIFDLNNKSLNRDDCLLPFFMLREKFFSLGYEMSTQDLIDPNDADIVLYNEMPKPYKGKIDSKKSYLMIFESELIRPDNWDLNKHKNFKKIFTWHDQFVDRDKYLKFYFPNKIRLTPAETQKRLKFLTLISGNKTCRHPLELYSKRLETIRWFEKNHPEEFDYYGIGWEYQMSIWWQKVFNRLRLLDFIPKSPSPSYRGKADSKFRTLKDYQFSICYENGKDVDGYITEKIIDCFVSGNIPVYWGPNNIDSHIPNNTFIDRRSFANHAELYSHLKEMSLETIQSYQDNIVKFLESDKGHKFSNECFVEIITKGLLSE